MVFVISQLAMMRSMLWWLNYFFCPFFVNQILDKAVCWWFAQSDLRQCFPGDSDDNSFSGKSTYTGFLTILSPISLLCSLFGFSAQDHITYRNRYFLSFYFFTTPVPFALLRCAGFNVGGRPDVHPAIRIMISQWRALSGWIYCGCGGLYLFDIKTKNVIYRWTLVCLENTGKWIPDDIVSFFECRSNDKSRINL